MAGEPQVTFIGNLAEDPKPFVTQAGVHISNLVLLNTPQKFDRQTNTYVDGVTNRMEVKVFRQLAAHANMSLKKGMRVVVTGGLTTETWVDQTDPQNPQNRYKSVLVAEDIGVSVMFGTVAYQKSAPAQQNAAPAPQVAQQGYPQAQAQQPVAQAPQQVAQAPQQGYPQQAQAPQAPQAYPQAQAPQPVPAGAAPSSADLTF